MASTQQHHFQQQQQEEAVLHSCLSLLDVAHAEGAKGVDVSRSMFRKPNPRALELILYHTYCVVKGKAAAKRVSRQAAATAVPRPRRCAACRSQRAVCSCPHQRASTVLQGPVAADRQGP